MTGYGEAGARQLTIAAERAHIGLIGYPDVGGARPLNLVVMWLRMKHNMASTADNSICRGILLAALIVIILNVPASAVSQRRMVDQEEPVVTHNPAGEYTSLMIDNMIAEAKTFNFSVIVISRLGLDEQLKYNNRRLHNALRRLIDYYDPGLPKGKVVGAVGERVNGPGRIEFYLQGKLVFVVDFKKNTDFDVDCCGADGWYYPYYRGRPKYEIW